MTSPSLPPRHRNDYYSSHHHEGEEDVEEEEEDVDSYLETSVWSEKASGVDVLFSDAPVVSVVVPPGSHSQMVYGFRRDDATETVFPTHRQSFAVQSGTQMIHNHDDLHYRRVARPRSPGPVAGPGEITNTSHGFTITLDVFQFAPEEIKVVLTDDTLSISGERLEYAGDGQTLRRSFSRKYSIPEDVHLDTIRSHLTNAGVLVINGSRKGWRETSISTQRPTPARDHRHRSTSVISTV